MELAFWETSSRYKNLKETHHSKTLLARHLHGQFVQLRDSLRVYPAGKKQLLGFADFWHSRRRKNPHRRNQLPSRLRDRLRWFFRASFFEQSREILLPRRWYSRFCILQPVQLILIFFFLYLINYIFIINRASFCDIWTGIVLVEKEVMSGYNFKAFPVIL